jgi:hypothetical protein
MGAMSFCLMLIRNTRQCRILVVIGCSGLADMFALATEDLFVADMDPLDLAFEDIKPLSLQFGGRRILGPWESRCFTQGPVLALAALRCISRKRRNIVSSGAFYRAHG